jgi:hypothetical protein
MEEFEPCSCSMRRSMEVNGLSFNGAMAKYDFVLEHATKQLSAQLQLNFQLRRLLRPEKKWKFVFVGEQWNIFKILELFGGMEHPKKKGTRNFQLNFRSSTLRVFDKAQKYVSMCFGLGQLWNMGLWWQHRLP